MNEVSNALVEIQFTDKTYIILIFIMHGVIFNKKQLHLRLLKKLKLTVL